MALAPRWTLRRLQARAAAGALVRHYEAAMPGRRTSGWNRSAGDADIALQGALFELRLHARDLVRNNAWAGRAQQVIANNTVGWGILPKAITKDAGAAAKAMELWNAWAGTTECESEGRHTFAGLQAMAMKTIVESGEVLFRRRWRQAKDGLTIPIQIQMLEPDYLDQAKQATGSQAGGPIVQGIEFDLLGRRAAYWLFAKHPGSGRNTQPSRRVPASEVLHVYHARRPGQSRGVSWFAAAIAALKDFDEYEDATLVRQKIAACFAAFIQDPDGTGVPLGAVDAASPTVETFEPGMITSLPPGKTVTFATPPGVTDDSFKVSTQRKIAAALGLTYEDLTGDYSKVNFSSARMARIAHWANVNDWRWNMLVPLLCDGVWAWAMEAAVVAGELAEAPKAEWTAPPMPMIEPDKEGLAIQRLVRTGAMTFSEMVRERGGDPDTHWAAYADEQKMLKAKGIVIDSDASQVSQAGQAQLLSGDSSTQIPDP
jgi:lambda family phage portal protein